MKTLSHSFCKIFSIESKCWTHQPKLELLPIYSDEMVCLGTRGLLLLYVQYWGQNRILQACSLPDWPVYYNITLSFRITFSYSLS